MPAWSLPTGWRRHRIASSETDSGRPPCPDRTGLYTNFLDTTGLFGMRASEADDAGSAELVLAADCLGGQELLLLFRERKRRRNAKGSKATGEAGRETSSSFGASAGCRREGNRPAFADSRCTHQNPFRMLKRVDDTCFGKPYGWHRIHHEIGATSLRNPF
jgi:hypothetical protein